MIARLPPLLAVIDGADYEQRGDAVYRVEHAGGREQRWCHIADWPAARERLEAAARQRRARIVALVAVEDCQEPADPPKPKRNNGRRVKATPEIVEQLKAAPGWSCQGCGAADARLRSLKDTRYCKTCARRRPIAGAQAD